MRYFTAAVGVTGVVTCDRSIMSAGAQLLKYLLAVLAMIPLLSLALVLGIVHRRTGWRLVRYWNRFSLWLFGVEVVLQQDCSNDDLSRGGIIVGLNQQSLLDPTIGYSVLDRHWMSIWNIEYALIPLFGWVSWVLGWVIVRQSPGHSQKQLAKAARYAHDGGLVYLSAEGKRSQDGSLSPYKKGPAVLAIHSQSRVFPLYIDGSRHCLPHGQWRIRPGRVVVRILAPVQVAGLTYDDRNDLLAELQALGERQHAGP
jgi:1-acyl-sn-glycerol-3-phosphate acyltransferase